MSVDLHNLVVNHLLSIIALLFLLHLLSGNVLLSVNRMRAYRVTICLTICVQIAEILTILLDTLGPAWQLPNILANSIGFILSAAIPYALAVTNDEQLLKRPVLLCLPIGAFCVLCTLSVWTGWIFSVSKENVYVRGPLFFVYILVFLGGLALLLWANYCQSNRFTVEEKWLLLTLYAIFFLGIFLQIVWPEIHSSWHCVTLSLLLYYIFQRELQFKYDLLTDVLNRASFAKDTSLPLPEDTVLMIFDLDSFKEINDIHGHQAGDTCLHLAALILQESYAQIGKCYRIGGDEFAVLGQAEETTLQAATTAMLRRVRATQDRHLLLPDISYGYSFLRSGETFSALFQRVDQQMYDCKNCRHDHENMDNPLEQHISV